MKNFEDMVADIQQGATPQPAEIEAIGLVLVEILRHIPLEPYPWPMVDALRAIHAAERREPPSIDRLASCESTAGAIAVPFATRPRSIRSMYRSATAPTAQMLTGSAYRVTVMARREDLRLTQGEPRTYVKTAESGRRRIQQFCGDCGAPLFTTGEGSDAEIWGIRWGSIRQRRHLAPRRQIWCRSAAAWIHGLGDLPGSERD